MAMAVANFTVPECTSYYQFLLSQGLLFGVRPARIGLQTPSSPISQLAAGFMYTPCLAIISHWCKLALFGDHGFLYLMMRSPEKAANCLRYYHYWFSSGRGNLPYHVSPARSQDWVGFRVFITLT